MIKIQIIILLLLAIFGVSLIVYALVHSNTAKNKETQISNYISVLIDSQSPARQSARAFIALMDLSFVLVHILTNHGNRYNDAVQTEVFCRSFSPELIEKLSSVEGNNG